MLANVGPLDRAVRIATGVLLIGVALVFPNAGWGWLGVAPLLSGSARHCPFYALLGVTTCNGE